MTAAPWRVSLGTEARRDFIEIVRYSRVRFGHAQAGAYKSLIAGSVLDLQSGPQIAGSIPRDDIGPGFRTLHVSRRGRRGRHLLLYRATGPGTIEVVRILHDRMNIPRHLPPGAP